MMTTNEPQDPRQPAGADSPGDIPAGRPAALSRLDALLGEWEMEGFLRGWLLRHWLSPGRRPGRPDQVHLAGRGVFLDPALHGWQSHRAGRHRDHRPGETAETFCQHYYDSRGVARIYQMSLITGAWKQWREASGFWQRYTAVFSDDGRTIKGAWEAQRKGRRASTTLT